ncbi:DNA-binding transcriptional regulator, FadR family [Paracoccus isoporae]|uniref:DNA-binding transcriptional regulator, FadR family n=1 Tax=Paracoccus isoporae TaxID=591205 RepID=A0A1G7DMT7_9RHOB|nr:FCD domain-containing protein [Paracoccus isoporae]SDE52792.1 DNA-binding transcriptional regulator, FadR family [Paracoccus isoporae]
MADISTSADAMLQHARRIETGRDMLETLAGLVELAGLKVGDRLPPEIELARRLGVSRSKVREALMSWQKMGIVTRNKGAGTVLAAEVTSGSIHLPLHLKIEAESLLRTHAVRRPLEIEAARLAAEHATPQQRREIRARMTELLAVYEAGEDWRDSDHRFHNAIHAASGNPLFGQFITQIQRAFDSVYTAPLGKPQLGQATIPMHRPLAEAIVSGDAPRASRIMAAILDHVAEDVAREMEAARG